MPSADIIRQTIDTYFGAISRLDPDAWAATFAEDGVSLDPYGSPPMRGRAVLREFLQGLCAAFDQVEMTPDEVFVSGDGAAVKWSLTGVGKAGQAVRFDGIDTFDIGEDGLIREARGYWDPAVMMGQLQ